MAEVSAGFILALAVAWVLTPACGWLARAVGLVDRPAPRKLHAVPTPLLGGAAVLAAVAAAVLVFARPVVREHVYLLLAGATIFAVIGLLDDARNVGAGKLAAEAAVVVGIVWAGDFRVVLPWPYLGETLVVLWIVGVANAFNCLDCADGVAAGAAAVAGLGLLALALWAGRLAVAVVAASVAGACLGFLRYNFPPARIFLGDAGSLTLGFVLASTAAVVSGGAVDPSRLLPPVLILAVPVGDFLLVHWRRYRAGVRPLTRLVTSTGKDHLPHRLLASGHSARRTAVRVYLAMGVLGAAAVGVAAGGPWLPVTMGGLAGAVTALGIRPLLLRPAPEIRWNLPRPASADDRP
ncbi:MAG: MraY family glycosyltransferase [Armatimonadota bacterium]|nr:MraY family glycosyltransferase [Armatimonadota bacterium]